MLRGLFKNSGAKVFRGRNVFDYHIQRFMGY